MDPVRKADWSLEEKRKFNEAILDINLEGPTCVEELIQKFPEKPVYQIRDQCMNYIVENLCTENAGCEFYDAKLDGLCFEATESDDFSLPVGKAKELAAIPPSVCEEVGEPSRERKKIEAGGEIGKEFEEATSRESNKGQQWTIEEHELFLHGLQKYGRGKWRMICWEFLKTRTPIQVASHAQKYFNRPKTPSNKRRTSIHDIRLPNKSTVVNANNAIPKSNYGHFTDSMDATPEGNYGQFANSNNTNPNSNNGHFANTLAQVSASGPSEPYRKICTEPSIPFWWASGML